MKRFWNTQIRVKHVVVSAAVSFGLWAGYDTYLTAHQAYHGLERVLQFLQSAQR